MAFPTVKWCLVCEDIRHEQGGLLTLIGFYGVLPNVEIRVRDFGLPLSRLAFTMMAEGISDGEKHRHRFQVTGPNNEIVLPGTESTAEPGPVGVGHRMQMSIVANSPRLPGPGLYRVVLQVDDKDHFVSTFKVIEDKQAK